MMLDILEGSFGKPLKSISKKDNNKVVIEFQDGTEIVAGVYGDCCSNSWIQEVAHSRYMNVAETSLTGVGIESQHTIEHPEYECLKTYYTPIQTSGGTVLITWCNSSNGYYGGYWGREV